MAQQILKSGNIYDEYHREQDKTTTQVILLVEGIIIALFPFLLPLLILTFYVWHRDMTDLTTTWNRKVDKVRTWTLLFLIPSFLVFYFFVFPYIPPNDLPVWGVYPQIALHTSMLVSVILFSITVLASAYLIYRVRKWCKVRCNPLRNIQGEDYMFIPTKDYGVLTLDKINTGIMVVGAPGGGKTELILQMMSQLPERNDYPWVVFDPKGDYAKEFAKEGDIVLALRGGTHAWNIFREIDMDPDDPDALVNVEEEIKEITSGLLSGDAWKNDKFWIQTARELLFAVIYMKLRDDWELYWNMKQEYIKVKKEAEAQGKKAPPEPESLKDFLGFMRKNYDLANYLKTSSLETLYKDLSKYDKLKAIANYVSKDSEKMGLSIFATLTSEIEKIFIGTFGSPTSIKLPQMSIREYMQNPNGRKLFILYDVQKGDVIGNIYKVLIERAIKYGLGADYGKITDREHENILQKFIKEREEAKKKGKKAMKDNVITRRKYFIIDEFQNIPPVRNYQQLVNFGRSLGCTSIIGVQSLAQIDKKYKQEGTNSIVAGHGTVISFRAYDKRTSQFIMERVGEHEFHTQHPITAPTPSGGQVAIGREIQRVAYNPVSEAEMRYMKPGNVLIITTHGWRKVRLYTYAEAIGVIKEYKKTLWRLKMHEKLQKRIQAKKLEMKKEMQKIATKNKKEIDALKDKKSALFSNRKPKPKVKVNGDKKDSKGKESKIPLTPTLAKSATDAEPKGDEKK